MAQGIQVPQTVPNAPQFQVPTDLVNAYLARQQQGNQDTMNRIQELGSTLHNYQQQKIQNQLAALGAYAGIAKAVGPDAANQVAGQIPNMPNWPNGGASNPSQTTPQQPQTQGTPSTGISAADTSAPTSPYISASLDAGHPDVTGYRQRMSQLNQQMGQFANKGDWGREQQQQVAAQLQGLKTEADMAQMPLSIAEKEANIRAANSKFASPEQGAAIASGEPSAVAGAYGGQAPVEAYNNAASKQMEVKKTVAGEISKQGQSSEQIGQIRQLYTDLQGALSKNTPSLGGNISGKVNQLTGGRVGSETAADVLNASNPLATALNTELSRRFNSGEVQLLSNSLIPQPMDTPAYAQKKMTRLNNMISAMESGNEQNVKNVANAITGGKISTTIMPTRSQPNGQQPPTGLTGPHGQTVVQNGHTYTWNGKTYE